MKPARQRGAPEAPAVAFLTWSGLGRRRLPPGRIFRLGRLLLSCDSRRKPDGAIGEKRSFALLNSMTVVAA